MLDTIKSVRMKLNPALQIEGLFFTMYQNRTTLCKGIADLVKERFGSEIKVFEDYVPFSIKAAEQPLVGKSILDFAPNNPVSVSYRNLAKELMDNGI